MLIYSEVSNRGTETQIVMALNSKEKEHFTSEEGHVNLRGEKYTWDIFVCSMTSQQPLKTM